MSEFIPTLLCDFYKISHREQYPVGTEVVYSTWTPRSSRIPEIDHVVNFGLQGFIQEWLMEYFNDNFFNCRINDVVEEYKRYIKNTLGVPSPHTQHIEDLHALAYLPILIKALPEGLEVPIRVPMFTIQNTHPKFFWLTNYLETLISTELWQSATSATIARRYRLILDRYAKETGGDPGFVQFQGHDFSMRGMSSIASGARSAAGHLLSFVGTDTITGIQYLEKYYGANIEKELVGCSIPATEHSVMCAHGQDEMACYKRIITEVYPKGFVSIVSDTWDLWKVLTGVIAPLKDIILGRDGKIIIRPDSGNPVNIVCGDPNGKTEEERKGVVEILWGIFGGTWTLKGFKQLDPHIGCIYGDAITLERVDQICARLKAKGFASTNMVYGVGSYCVSPETLILCSDLVWRSADSLEDGYEIIAFDENPTFGIHKLASRRYKKAKIISNSESSKMCSRIYTDIGPAVTASDDHPWLVWAKNRSHKTVYLGSTQQNKRSTPRTAGLVWKRTSQLGVGDKIAFLAKPWKLENNRSSGWLEGMYDGEGCVSRSTPKEIRIPAWKINISQNIGPILDRIRIELRDRNFDFYENVRECPQLVLKGGWSEMLRFLGEVSPSRLRNKLPTIIDDMPMLQRDRTFKLSTVTGIEPVGWNAVASIQTSCGTFITNGYLSHNTYQCVSRDTFGFAMKSTHCVINGVQTPIFKDPVTDGGVKKSARGVVRVHRRHTGELFYTAGHTLNSTEIPPLPNLLKPVFENSRVLHRDSLADIRRRLAESN